MSSGWRTIESAPKDGTLVIIWNGHAIWGSSRRLGVPGQGGQPTYGHDWVMGANERRPTHWHPLPAPPTPTSTEKDRACTCGKPRSWPWLFCGENACNFTPFTTAQRTLAVERRKRLEGGGGGARAMADRWDAAQCPARWTHREPVEYRELFA